uniref:Uncharacterized protein n=1 Tax=Lepeophtheirus salmonis TaxID=72036 RepID=A0A0K2T325_LEPSM
MKNLLCSFQPSQLALFRDNMSCCLPLGFCIDVIPD